MNRQLIPWRRNCGLAGASVKYDFFLGCYGNPDRAETIFVAEIPSLFPKNIVADAYPREDAWKSAWRTTESDLIFRVALKTGGFIPFPLSDEPFTWNCWITDFVKCGEVTTLWRKMRDSGAAEKILDESSTLLKEELTILEPKCVVFVGHHAEEFFEDSRELLDLQKEMGFTTKEVTHYAAIRRSEDLEDYYQSYLNLCPNE